MTSSYRRYSNVVRTVRMILVIALLFLVVSAFLFNYHMFLYLLFGFLCGIAGLLILRSQKRKKILLWIIITVAIIGFFLSFVFVLLPPQPYIPPIPECEYNGKVTMSDDKFIIDEILEFYPEKQPLRVKLESTYSIMEHVRNLEGNWNVTEYSDFIKFERHREIEVDSQKEGLIVRKAIIKLPEGSYYTIKLVKPKVILNLPENAFLESRQQVITKQRFKDTEAITLEFDPFEPRQVEFTFLADHFRYGISRQISLLSFSGWISTIASIIIGFFTGAITIIFSDALKNRMLAMIAKIKKEFRLRRK